ncbi:hypothetical protein [Paraburkholderia sp. RL17-373-BIF-A]|uniref:hypothetical protein n=1 Tax=Paraburkholderia sp. RL17-373-BIF-A TaxID=3031629 RepID=UPI0038BC27AF
MTDINAPTLPALRIKAWRALVVGVSNFALSRHLFYTNCPPGDFPEDTTVHVDTRVDIVGRPFALHIEDTGRPSLTFQVFASKRHSHAAWGIRRSADGLSIETPAKRMWLNGFSMDELATLAAMPVEPIGYGFSKQGENYAR